MLDKYNTSLIIYITEQNFLYSVVFKQIYVNTSDQTMSPDIVYHGNSDEVSV